MAVDALLATGPWRRRLASPSGGVLVSASCPLMCSAAAAHLVTRLGVGLGTVFFFFLVWSPSGAL